MNWQQAYPLPLRKWEDMDIKVFTADNSLAWDFMFEMFAGMFESPTMIISPEQQNDIISLVNGEKKGSVEGTVSYDKDEGTIKVDGKILLLVRGWGHLTGGGALNLPPDKAAEIQDAFAEHIVNKLSGK